MEKLIRVSLFILFYSASTYADNCNLSVSLAEMNNSAVLNKETGKIEGAYIDLLDELEKTKTVKFKKKVYPFARSLNNVLANKYDLHIPLIKNPIAPLSDLPYQLSDETLFIVPFVLYTNINRKIDVSQLNKYQIFTDRAHTSFFPFPIKASTCIPCTLKMVQSGRVDGYIFAQVESDPFVKKFNLSKIKRTLYKNFEVKVVFPKSKRGNNAKECFSKSFGQIEDQKRIKKALTKVLGEYDDWQPWLISK